MHVFSETHVGKNEGVVSRTSQSDFSDNSRPDLAVEIFGVRSTLSLKSIKIRCHYNMDLLHHLHIGKPQRNKEKILVYHFTR